MRKPEQIATFRANDILYDREGNAEHPQVCAETFDRRFFFER
jgi:4-hydroxyphenylpyruvate dioxygenase-like putative hemolysin